MSDDRYEMDDEGLRKAEEWLKRKWPKDPKCMMCGHTDWNIQKQLTIVSLFKSGAMIAGPGFPALVVICSNCAHMIFVNAMIAGIVAEKEGTSDGE